MGTLSQDFEPAPESARKVRSFVRATLPEMSSPAGENIVLVVSELASHLIRHAGTDFTVEVGVDPDRMRVELSDDGSVVPALEDLLDHRGALHLLDLVSDRWGTSPAVPQCRSHSCQTR